MGFYLEKDEDAAVGLRRILQEQTAHLLKDLRMKDREEAIHEARKRCKRVRSVARLLRFTAKNFQERENRAFRDLARSLSAMRDAQVQAETFDKLVRREKHGPARYVKLRPLLPDANRMPATVQKRKLSALAKPAQAARKRFDRLKLPKGRGFSLIEKGLRRSYKRGREAMITAAAQGDAAAFHKWRKRVKDLGYQMQLLHKLWPPVLKRVQKEIDELGEVLGREHDLMVMRAALLKKAGQNAPPQLLHSFFVLLKRHAAELRSEARAIGRRVFAERPRAFLKRIATYWKTWQAEIPGQAILHCSMHLKNARTMEKSI